MVAGACSLINAPAEIDPGTSAGGGGTGGEAGTGGTTTSDTTSSTTSDTTPPDECGDGKKTGAEGCDDDNTADGDGCSATCAEEDGFTCNGPAGGLSACTKDCGNGTIDMGEECDDKGKTDSNPTDGDQDPCNDACRFQEFDIELAATMVANEAPTIAFRRDKADDGIEYAAFFPVWYSSVFNKIRGREYKFDGFPLKGTGLDDFSLTTMPDTSGHTMCTASSNRSNVFWRNVDKIQSRKIESSGEFQSVETANILAAGPNPRCAASDDSNSFIVASLGNDGTGEQVFVQPYTSFAQVPNGPAIGLGLTNGPTDIAAWPLFQGFGVAFQPDSINGGPMVGRPLDKTGAQILDMNAMPVNLPLTEPTDTGVRQPTAARIGTMNGDNSFAFVYVRNNPGGYSEVVYRIFAWPNMNMPPNVSPATAVSAEMSAQSQPFISVNPMNGKFVVVWTVQAPSGENVVYKAFGLDGKPMSLETIAPEKINGKQTSPAATVNPQTGDVAIVWATDLSSDTKPSRIAGKIFPGLLK